MTSGGETGGIVAHCTGGLDNPLQKEHQVSDNNSGLNWSFINIL